MLFRSTLSLSTEAVAAKLAFQGGANIITAVTLRYLLAATIFWSVLILMKTPFRLPAKDLLRLVVMAVVFKALTVLALFNAFSYIPAAMAILFLYVYPAVVTVLSYFILREPLTSRKIISLTLTLAGCAVILGQPLHGLDLRGVGFSVLAAVLNAFFLVFTARIICRVPVQVFTAYITGISAVFFLAVGIFWGGLSLEFDGRAAGAIVFMAVICTVVAFSALYSGVEKIGASRAAIISTFEPVATAVLGFWILAEGLSAWQIFGSALVLTGVFLQRRE